MSERKSINKYIPPDYDPSKMRKDTKPISRGKHTVRIMTPFSMRCEPCGEYIAKSKKFNARKRTSDEHYLGTKIIKLHIKCPRCFNEIIIRTDPQHGDYLIESGATRNYDPNKNKSVKEPETLEETLERLEREEQEDKKKLAEDAKQLVLKGGKKGLDKDSTATTAEQIEQKLVQQQREQQQLEELEELRQRNIMLDKANGFDNQLIRKAAGQISTVRDRQLIDDENEFAKQARMAFNERGRLQGKAKDNAKMTISMGKRKKTPLGVIVKKRS